MKTAFISALFILLVVGSSSAADLPTAPSSVATTEASPMEFFAPAAVSTSKPATTIVAEPKVMDKKFVSLALISTGVTFSDSYTTLFARQNWLAGKQHVCNAEIQSAYLYGTHPTVARTYAVASVKSVGSIALSYYLRKHHQKLWALPLVANTLAGAQGTTQNMIACN